ncbi:MAG: alkylmercury lyase [Firmicutes bacterium HGW-Firmicutes-15]|nr:MAG: alkylmercury lyase [Firmicutes bacterium HGW-Firmicutes-15]
MADFRSNLKFKDYDASRILIDSIASKLTQRENEVRNMIINDIVNNGKAFVIDNVADDIKEIILALKAKNALAIAEDNNIYSIYPVSAQCSNHKVTLKDGRELKAMCAVDALGATYTFNQDTKIDSKCTECGKEIKVVVVGGNIVSLEPTDAHVLHADLNRFDNWSCSCCNTMHFFCSKEHCLEWVNKNNVCKDSNFCIDANEALSVGRMIFSDNE